MKLVLNIILICTGLTLSAQYALQLGTIDIKSKAMANCGVAAFNFNSQYMNPAHLSVLTGHGISIHSTNYYSISKLFGLAASVYYKANTNSGFGIGYATEGTEALRANNVQLAYGRKISSLGSIGMAFNYNQLRNIEQKNNNSFSVDLGVQYQLKTFLMLALKAQNIIPFETKKNAHIAAKYRLGIEYKVYEHLSFNIEIQKQEKVNLSYHASAIYRIKTKVEIYTGFHTNNNISTGLSFNLKNNLSMTFAMQYHSVLGFSPSFGSRYNFSN